MKDPDARCVGHVPTSSTMLSAIYLLSLRTLFKVWRSLCTDLFINFYFRDEVCEVRNEPPGGETSVAE